MKAALVTPFISHLPLYPSSFLGYGAAILRKSHELDIIDFNAKTYFRNRQRLKELISSIDKYPVAIDAVSLLPLYYEISNNIEGEYEKISWSDYGTVYITIPSWFVTVPTEAVLGIANCVKGESTDTKIHFFGNSLGSWTDENELRNNNIHVRHLNHLFESGGSGEPVNYDSLPTPIYENRNKYLFDILPFRLKHGCIWGKCRFCSLAKGWNFGYLERSPKKVIRELEELIDKYDPRMFACTDNSINGRNLFEFCSYFKEFNKPWAGMARADLSKKDISVLQESGCRLIYFGLESGSDRVLREIDKGISSRQFSEFIKNLHEHNIIPAPSLFVGSPTETEDDFRKTIQFIMAHRDYLNVLNVYPLLITPGSDFSVENKKPDENVFSRLSELTKVCEDIGIKVCVGEQCGEYAICNMAYQGSLNY